MTFDRQREVFSHEEGTFIAYICFIFLYICFYPVGDSRNKCNLLIFPFEYTSVSSCHYHDDNMMKFEEFVKNNLNPELFGGKRLTIDAYMYLLVKEYVVLKKDSVVNITCIVGASV